MAPMFDIVWFGLFQRRDDERLARPFVVLAGPWALWASQAASGQRAVGLCARLVDPAKCMRQ
jgi:hypothetical protein